MNTTWIQFNLDRREIKASFASKNFRQWAIALGGPAPARGTPTERERDV